MSWNKAWILYVMHCQVKCQIGTRYHFGVGQPQRKWLICFNRVCWNLISDTSVFPLFDQIYFFLGWRLGNLGGSCAYGSRDHQLMSE